MDSPPLFADIDIDGVIGILITIAIIGFSVISKIVNEVNGGNRRPAPPAQPGQRPPQPPNVRGRAPARSVEAEIEDFLRQARGGQAPTPPQPPRVIEAVPVEDEIVPGRDFARDLSSHVEEHIGHDSISRRDAHLGDAVESSDERIEHHLEEVFDHDVGKLSHHEKVDTSIAEGTDDHSWEEKANASSHATADRIAEMLKSPQGVREAFIMAEILKRPEI